MDITKSYKKVGVTNMPIKFKYLSNIFVHGENTDRYIFRYTPYLPTIGNVYLSIVICGQKGNGN